MSSTLKEAASSEIFKDLLAFDRPFGTADGARAPDAAQCRVFLP
jgi:hypothetical protein